MASRLVDAVTAVDNAPRVCLAMSCSGASGRGVNSESQAPHRTSHLALLPGEFLHQGGLAHARFGADQQDAAAAVWRRQAVPQILEVTFALEQCVRGSHGRCE